MRDEDPSGLGVKLHESVQSAFAECWEDYDGVVVAVGVIAEVLRSNGDRQLVDVYVTNAGEQSLSHWAAKGMLRDSLDNYDRLRGRNG